MRKIDSLKLDLVIFSGQEMLSALVSTKSFGVVHDLMHRYADFPEFHENHESEIRDFYCKNIYKAAERIFVDSEIGKKHVIESYGASGENKICILPFTPPQYLFEKDKMDLKFNLPGKFIFYPAQLWFDKNHKNLLLAISFLKKNGLDVKLVLAGSKKNAFNEIVQLIATHSLEENVEILGYVSDDEMRYLYKHARAMVMPSFLGPTNIPPLEGMATGCPVAVSNVYAMPDQVGTAGLVFDPCNIEEIADVIERLWKDDELCRELSARGLERVKLFSQDVFNVKFQKIIREYFDISFLEQ